MTIIATETFSNGVISMFKGEIREITEGDPEYTTLLSEGLVEEYSAGGGGGGGSVFLIQMTETEDYDRVLNKTWKEIYDAYMSGATCIVQKAKTEYDPEDKPNGANMLVINVYWDQDYSVDCASWTLGKFYVYDENGYPKNYSE